MRHPVAIGGVGGSGTRVVANLLHILGYFLGDDVNESMDNVWFTLLFKRRSILLEQESDFRSLMALFQSRMSGNTALSEQERSRVFLLAEDERLQHSRDWLVERACSFANGKTSKRPGQPWGWKEPNTHVMIDRIFASHADLRCIHVARHPLDMALSGNQNQLQNWGPIFLNRDVRIEPRLSLSYWCAAHRRMMDFMRSWPERTMMVDFDSLCTAPDLHCTKLLEFLGIDPRNDTLAEFREVVRPAEARWRSKSNALGQYDPRDLEYVAKIGYPL